MSVYDNLAQLNITLPPVATPAAAYVPFVRTGNLVFLSGHIARRDGMVRQGLQISFAIRIVMLNLFQHPFASLELWLVVQDGP